MDKVSENELMKKSSHDLIKKADVMFSELVRKFYATQDGRVRCCTCGTNMYWKYLSCGHYMARRHNATRWELKNAGPQCLECNGPGQGMPVQMAEWIDKTHGAGTSEEMILLANADFRLDKIFIINRILTLKTLLNGFEGI